MALKFFKTKEEVPEAQRDAAHELADKRWVLEEKEEDLDDGGKDALAKERSARDRAEKARKKAQDDLDALQRTVAAQKTGATEEQLAAIRTAEAAARKPIEDERDLLRVENRKLKLNDRVKALFLESGGMPDRVDDAMVLLTPRTDLGDAGGIVVKDKTGATTAETIENFLKVTFKAEKPYLYKGTGSSGSGAEGSDGGEAPAGKPVAEQIKSKAAEISGAF